MTTKPETSITTSPPPTKASAKDSSDSSEESSEDFEKMRANLKELLSDAEKKEFDEVVIAMEKATTLDESLQSMVRKS